MLQGLDEIPWGKLEHAYGPARDVPRLLRQLLDARPKVRGHALQALYGNVFHQGTRYPATPHVIPFLIEMCASPAVPDRGNLLRFWGSLIAGYFTAQERPYWGDGEHIYVGGEVQEVEEDNLEDEPLHQIYRESLRGHELLCSLLSDADERLRAEAAWVLACLPTRAAASLPKLRARLRVETSGWVRAALAFALGELGAAAPLRRLLARDAFPAARCMAACQLARLEPSEVLIEPLLQFLAEPIDGYEEIPGAGGQSTGDAAFAVSRLPPAVQRTAIPALCDRLDRARAFATMPLVGTLLAAAFPRQKKKVTQLTALQKRILVRMLHTEELWSIGNLMWTFEAYGLPHDRTKCARLAGVKVAEDKALEELRTALAMAEINFLREARKGFRKALELDPAVFERAPAPEECWLLCAKAFAETDANRALAAYQNAVALKPAVARRVDPTWRLADLLKRRGAD